MIKQNDVILSPVTRKRLYEDISLQLQIKIVNEELPAGVKLPPERDLAAQFRVNRTTIREAIRNLEQMGLLDVKQGDGVYVKDYLESDSLEILRLLLLKNNGLNTKVIGDILQIRSIISPRMAAEAALRRTESMILDLKQVIESKDISVLEADIAVHKLIARASGNVFYILAINFFNPIVRAHAQLYFADDNNMKVSRKFHADIISAIERKDAAGAEKIMRDVVVYAEEMTMKAFGGVISAKGVNP